MANTVSPADNLNLPALAYEPVDEHNSLGSARSAFNLRYIAAAIRSNLWLIIAIVAATLAIALVATLLQTPRYTASTTIQINDTGARVFGTQDDEGADSAMNRWDVDRFLKTQVEVLQSRSLALRVAQSLKLTGNPRFYASQEMPRPEPGMSPELMRNSVIAMLKGHLKVDLPRDSRIVTISFESTDKEMSAMIANSYAAEFIQSNLQRKFDSSSYARNFLSEQLTEAKSKVESSEEALNAYAREHGLIRATDTGTTENGRSANSGQTVTSSSLFQLNQAANLATSRRIEAESRWRSVSSGPLLNASEVLKNPVVSSLMTKKAELEGSLAEDRARHLDDYPSVRAKQSELAAINQQLAGAATSVRNSILAEYRSALDAERQLTEKVTQMKDDTLSEQDKMVKYGLLAREVETNRQLYNELLERYKKLNAVAGVSLSNVAIIDNANPPVGPSSPNLFKNLMVGFLLGAGLAALTVFLKDQFDDSIRVPEDVEIKLGLSLLGVVPKSLTADPDEALADPKSPVSEAYNSLRGSLLYSTSQGLPQILLVTSAQAAEGKTTTSYAVSSGFARMGKRTLLIDADMRRPSLHRRLGLDNERGLSTLLTTREALTTVQIGTGHKNLTAVMAGPIPPSPTELLSTARFEEILQEAAGDFDVVVIDSPPILGLADAPSMSALVDGVIFVVEADRSRRGSLKSALRRLRAMRPILLGAVLTKFDPLKAGNRYSEYYGYEYYQYDSTTTKG